MQNSVLPGLGLRNDVLGRLEGDGSMETRYQSSSSDAESQRQTLKTIAGEKIILCDQVR